MVLFDAVLKGFAVLSTIVASLRAGSRVLYISEHGAIGLVDGPRIAAPTTESVVFGATNETVGNETEPMLSNDETGPKKQKAPYNPALYELSESFKQCVMVSSPAGQPHGCENVFRDRLITDALPPPSATAEEELLPAENTSSPTSFLHGGFRKLRNQIRSLAEEQMRKQNTRTNPFGEESYTLSTTHYSPKRFQTKNKRVDFSSPLESFGAAAATKIVTESNNEVIDYDPFDSRRTTEADYFYNTVSVSPKKSSRKRKRVAQLTAYCPHTFYDLRSNVFGVSEEEYLRSMLGNMVSFQSNSKGAARAGGIFFFTSDGAYMIKTIPNREKKTMLKILPDYYEHMKRYGRSSLLTRFCGMYGITIEEEDLATTVEGVEIENDNDEEDSSKTDILGDSDEGSSSFAPTGKEYTFVVMNAVFPAEAKTFISERFDLKGSTVGREVSREELESKGRMAVLKDLDLSREVDLVRSKQKQQEEEDRVFWNSSRRQNRWLGGRNRNSIFGVQKRRGRKVDASGFTIGATAKAALLSQLRKDVQFLTKCQVMDYSLLVGVVHTDGNAVGSSTGQDSNSIMTPELVETIQEQSKVLEHLEAPPPAAATTTTTSAFNQKNKHRLARPKLDSALLHTLTTPIRLMLSPPLYIAKKSYNTLRLTLDSIVTAPMPYYGSGNCRVYGGKLSVMHGQRKGKRATYYLGLIDFLQPWTTRKVMERKLKGLAGYDTNAISAVTPEEYATRFLEFLDKNIN